LPAEWYFVACGVVCIQEKSYASSREVFWMNQQGWTGFFNGTVITSNDDSPDLYRFTGVFQTKNISL